ncbi:MULTISPECIES: DUF5325 family protein [Virgibacillus]|uniref:DUF5325 family protein n=1 Tax=Virgibacillus dokdonensis TaxID=302167 RepID=A0ABU7VDB7_9BACI|nr:DUF5325 family protein [Virgibacillus sp.]NWO15145.1 DUF5325 family protein [Virgibacillus sp.]
MKKLNIPMLLLAILVIGMFVGVGAAIAYRNTWLVVLFLLLGFTLMGTGIRLKKARE